MVEARAQLLLHEAGMAHLTLVVDMPALDFLMALW